jgi:hypothetical protein
MFDQHIPLVKPFTHRHFKSFTGNVVQFQCSACSIPLIAFGDVVIDPLRGELKIG